MKDYIKLALRTESARIPLPTQRESRLLHAAIGMATEAGEFLDALKKCLFYGKPLDSVNLKEELGDSQWYQAIACDALETDFTEIQEINIAKLRARYPEKFCEIKAENRDLEAERGILEMMRNREESTARIHNLKTDPTVFQASVDGVKTFEIRKNDRDFHVGDLLILEETKYSGEMMALGHPLEYTGRCLHMPVKYILHGPAYGLAEGWCILS